MAQRIPLAIGLTAGQNSTSIPIRLDDPPFTFVATGGFGGTIKIEGAVDQQLPPAQQGATDGVSDANSTWFTVVASLASGAADTNWKSPLVRVRVNGASVTTGAANVYMLAGVRSLKNTKSKSTQSRTQTRNG